MTTDLEKQFFDTFGIEPKKTQHSCYGFWENGIEDCPVKKCDICKYKHETLEYYPQITDRILLELFDILRATYNIDFWSTDKSFVMDLRDKQASYTNIIYRTGGDFKSSILSSLNLIVKDKLIGNDKIKQQVQALFKE